jgi:hypothetical protein
MPTKSQAACFHTIGSNFYFCLAPKRGLSRFVDWNFDLDNFDSKVRQSANFLTRAGSNCAQNDRGIA